MILVGILEVDVISKKIRSKKEDNKSRKKIDIVIKE